MREPQWPQKGRSGPTGFAHLGQGVAFAATTGAVGAVNGLAGAVVCGFTLPGATRAAEADSGFPQSMQNRDIGSLSRPQKAQETSGVMKWGRPSARIYAGCHVLGEVPERSRRE